MNEDGEHPFQITERDVLVHHKALNLMEHGGVSHVGITSVRFTRCNYPHRWRLLFHDSDLNGGCVSAEHYVVRDIEGILHVPGRVVFGNIERLEIIIIQFHIRPFDDLKSQTQEDLGDFHADSGYGMEMTKLGYSARQRNIQDMLSSRDLGGL